MTQLSELVAMLGKDRLLCSCRYPDDSPINTLYRYLRSNERPTAEEAAAALGLKPGEPAFRKAKHQLKIELINDLTRLPLNRGRGDQRKRSFDYVWKLIAIAKQSRTNLSSEVLLPFLEDAHRTAVKYQFVDAAYESAVMLRRQYVNRRFNPTKYAHFAEQALKYRSISRDLQDAVSDLNSITFLRNSKADPEAIADLAREAHAAHAPLIEKHDLVMVSYIVYLLEVNKYLAVSDYEGVIEVATRALEYLSSREQAQPTMFQVFEANLTVAYTQTNDYERGTLFARQLLSRTTPSDYNYFKVYELLLLLALRAGKFQEAYENFRQIRPDLQSSNLPPYYSETFRIIEAYLYLLIEFGEITEPEGDDPVARFRISRFLNSFEYVTTEKSHRNVHLLIIEIVYGILHERHANTTHTIESITKYANRHLRGKEYQRVRYFLKALAQLSVQQYHRTAVERHTRRYVKGMQEHPLAESRLDYYMELIPYETLWNLILGRLGFKRIAIR